VLGKKNMPLLFPQFQGREGNGDFEKGLNLLVWKSYDWWGSVDGTKNF
jgi:hypothetical protein